MSNYVVLSVISIIFIWFCSVRFWCHHINFVTYFPF